MKRKIIKTIISCCTFVGATVVILGIFYLITTVYNSNKHTIGNKTVLVVDFANNYNEISTDSILDEIFEVSQMDFKQLIDALSMAANDNKIDSIVAKIDVSNMEFAQIQEVADIINKIRNKGKKTYVFSQSFGSLGHGNIEYYLASFFDEIYMQPHTTIGLTGINIEIPFARNTFNKIGIYPEFYQRYEYKTAMMSFTDDKISLPYKENMSSLGNSLMNTLIKDIANNRNTSPENIKKYINKAPIFAEDGIKSGLIDGIMYYSELKKLLKERGAIDFVTIQEYASHIVPNSGYLPVIAYLNISGIIDSGESHTDYNGDFTVGSSSVMKDLEEIKDIPNLKALVVRVDSPGGSYHAADDIYFAIKTLKEEKNIPVIISQSGYAASGGYFISLAGDVIVAEPTTITGSIGVLGGKFVLEEMWKKIGVNWADVSFGKNSDILSINKRFSSTEKQMFNKSLDVIYNDFVEKVKENRKLTQSIDKIAKGRVWTGEQAIKLGLVDEIGGIVKSIDIAYEKADIKPNQRIIINTYPKKKTFTEKINEFLTSQNIRNYEILKNSGVDIRYLKLFKQLQYDTVLPIFQINM